MKIHERITHSESETIELGQAIGHSLRRGDCVALVGPLGAGKTRLVRGIVRGLGIDPRHVSSPTFTIVHEYSTQQDTQTAPDLQVGQSSHPPSQLLVRSSRQSSIAAPTALTVIHMDAYRLSGPDDLASIGWSCVQDPDAIIVIEWADRLAMELPPLALTISISHIHHVHHDSVAGCGSCPPDPQVGRASRPSISDSCIRQFVFSAEDAWRDRLEWLDSTSPGPPPHPLRGD